MYLQRRDQRRAAEPFVECNVRDSRQPGWASIFITVRNFHPHMLHVRELRVLAPRTAAIYHEREAFRNDGSAYDPKRVFIATSEPARLIARIDASVRPYGSEPKYSANALMSPGDVITEEFYFSARVQDRPISVKMALICEVRSRVVRQLRIPINRTITLDSASKAG
jgi:hypothetical protein